MKPAVHVTRSLFPEAEALLARHFARPKRPGLAEGLLTQLTDRVDAAFLARFPRARVVSQCAVGVDNIDLEEAARRRITVMNTPGVLTDATADMTWALILAAARRLVEADRLARAGRYRGWDLELLLGLDLRGRTLGIVGMGRIGAAVARRAKGFGLRIVYTRRRAGRSPLAPAGARRVTLQRLLRVADVVTLHVPATPATRHLIGAAELARMKPTAILVNTSRGWALDEAALAAALRAGRIQGAGLDVFEREPAIPAALRRLSSVVLTPHVASATRATRGAMALTAARNLVDYFAGRPAASRCVIGPRSRLRARAAGPATSGRRAAAPRRATRPRSRP